MGQSGSLKVASTADEPTVLELELQAFPGDRRVAWLLDGRPLGELKVAPDWRRYEIPLPRLPRGESTLTLACNGPPTVANDIRHNGDPRDLCLALGGWRLQPSAPLR
jgi:hypothetical protein